MKLLDELGIDFGVVVVSGFATVTGLDRKEKYTDTSYSVDAQVTKDVLEGKFINFIYKYFQCFYFENKITVHDGPLDFHDESYDDIEIFKRLNIGYAQSYDICGNLHCYQHYRTFFGEIDVHRYKGKIPAH